MLLAGQLLYWGSLVPLGLLAKRLLPHYRTFPAFVSYIWTCLGSTVVLFALAYSQNQKLYDAGFMLLRYACLFLLGCVFVELIRHGCGRLAWERTGQMASVVPVWLLLGNYSLELDRGIALTLGLAMAMLAIGNPNKQSVAIIAGLFIVKFFDAAVWYAAALQPGTWLQLVPTIAFNVAVVGCWLPAFPNRRKQ